MRRPKMFEAMLIIFSLLSAVSLTGCQSGKDLPFYLMEKHADYSESLSIDGIQYHRKSGGLDEQAHYYADGDLYTWTPAEGIGEQIGVCGKDANKKASLNIYEVAGDEDHVFLYTWPANFYFGGVESRLWMQDGVTLGPPAAETVSSVAIVSETREDAPIQVDDPAMIAALLEAYRGSSVQTLSGDGWVFGSLVMRHKDFPFLQYEIRCRYSLEQQISYCENKSRKWLPLPDEWFSVISENRHSIGESQRLPKP